MIREELQIQLEPLVTSSSKAQSNNMYPQQNAAVQVQASEEQQLSYHSADQLIDDAALSGNWDSSTDSQLTDYLQKLTPEQEFEIRAKYANAINEGLITSEAPLGMAKQ